MYAPFARIQEDQIAIVVIPRFIATFGLEPNTWPLGKDVWEDTHLQLPSNWGTPSFRNIFSDEIVGSTQEQEKGIVLIADVLQHFPVALLTRTL